MRQNSVNYGNLVKIVYILANFGSVRPFFLTFFIFYVPVSPFITSKVVNFPWLAPRYRDTMVKKVRNFHQKSPQALLARLQLFAGLSSSSPTTFSNLSSADNNHSSAPLCIFLTSRIKSWAYLWAHVLGSILEESASWFDLDKKYKKI